MDTVQVVNNYIQSGNMEYFKDIRDIILLIFTGSLVYFACKMKGLAEASNKNAETIRSLEETNIKIAMMPEVRDMLKATWTFMKNVSDKKQKNIYRILDDYYNDVQYVWLFLKKDSELIVRINDLIREVTDLNQIQVKREKKPDNAKLSREWTEKNLLIQSIFKDIHVMCKKIFGFAIDLIPPQ